MAPRPLDRPAARRLVAWLAGPLLFAASAAAQRPDASASFDYGLAEMLAGRYATGCPALETSFRLDPRPGTLFTLADCDRNWGRSASALARFDEFLALYERMPPDQKAKPRERERAAVAATERAALEKSVPLLAVRLAADAPPATRVWRDDVELTGTAIAAAIPVDPGDHRIRVQTTDGQVREQEITLQGGEQRTVIAGLGPEAAPSAAPASVPPPPPLVAAPTDAAQTSPPDAPAPPAHASRTPWIVATAGLGAASLIAAGVTGGVALGQRSIAAPVCDARGVCTTEQGVSAGNLAHTMANVETGALVIAGAALVTALTLWWTAPRAATKTHAATLLPAAGGLVAEW